MNDEQDSKKDGTSIPVLQEIVDPGETASANRPSNNLDLFERYRVSREEKQLQDAVHAVLSERLESLVDAALARYKTRLRDDILKSLEEDLPELVARALRQKA
ncbi:MAG: hypothetical protein PVI37_09295 [Gammaproteobacteria bacterium]|jgi:hypothetical protein